MHCPIGLGFVEAPYLVLVAIGIRHNPVPPVELHWAFSSLIDNAYAVHEDELTRPRAVGQE